MTHWVQISAELSCQISQALADYLQAHPKENVNQIVTRGARFAANDKVRDAVEAGALAERAANEPSDNFVANRLATRLYKLGHVSCAKNILQKLADSELRFYCYSDDPVHDLLVIAYLAGDYPDGSRLIELSKTKYPQDLKLVLNEALLFHAMKKYELALVAYDQWIDGNVDNPAMDSIKRNRRLAETRCMLEGNGALPGLFE